LNYQSVDDGLHGEHGDMPRVSPETARLTGAL